MMLVKMGCLNLEVVYVDGTKTLLTPSINVDDDWHQYIDEMKHIKLVQIIKDDNLNQTSTEDFIEKYFRDGFILLPYQKFPIEYESILDEYFVKSLIKIPVLRLFLLLFLNYFPVNLSNDSSVKW